jgi:hypothetical protein
MIRAFVGECAQVADEHELDVLGTLGRAVHDQDGGRRRHGVDDADERLLGNAPLLGFEKRQERRADDDGPDGEPAGGRVVQVVPEEESDRGPERRDLRKRQVDEDDAALHDVESQVGVDPRDGDAREERPKKERNRLDHGLPPASAFRIKSNCASKSSRYPRAAGDAPTDGGSTTIGTPALCAMREGSFGSK